jgi:hypothetical protein
MIIIAKEYEKVLLMDCKKGCFIVAKINDNGVKIGDTIEKYDEKIGTTHWSLEQAILAFHYIKYNWDTVECVFEDIDLEDYGIFECTCCGETKSISERCTEHYDELERVCKDCCDECRREEAYWDKVDSEIDEYKLGY